MSTISIAKRSLPEDDICQGDIYKSVKYSYIDAETNDDVSIIEYEFPLAVIISQACDVIAMEKMAKNHKGKPAKFMPGILMCPIYDKDLVKSGTYIEEGFNNMGITMDKEEVFHKDDYKVAERDWHYRFHALQVKVEDKPIITNALLDFKHYFTVSIQYLIEHKNNRILHLTDPFAEQLTLKYATYLSRVAIP